MTLRLILFLLAVSCWLSSCSEPQETPTPPHPLDVLLPYQQVELLDTLDFREPSGLVFHPGRGTLFVIGDEGAVAEFRPDGTPLSMKQLGKGDFEGITVNPASGLLYAIDENKGAIIEINPDDFTISGSFTIAPDVNGTLLPGKDKGHSEAIAFVPDPQHPEGGLFYLANQSTTAKASFMVQVEAPLKRRGDTATITGSFALPIPDLSDLSYQSSTAHLLLISDQTNTIIELALDGEIDKAYALPGDNQEGIAIDNDGFLYLAQDSGGILKFKPLPATVTP